LVVNAACDQARQGWRVVADHLDELLARRLPAQDSDRAARHAQPFGEEIDDRAVPCPVDRRAVTWTFKTPPCTPTTWSRALRGCTRMAIRTAVGVIVSRPVGPPRVSACEALRP
jgi:hypothetical protein